MLSLIAGIIILIIVVLALAKSLLANQELGGEFEDDEYPEDAEVIEYPAVAPERARRAHDPADKTIDDFVLQDAVDEDHDLTGVWEDDQG
jgi:hypothetical protein